MKKDLVNLFQELYNTSIKTLLNYVRLSESSYHYEEKINFRKGAILAKYTNHKILDIVKETKVIESIKRFLNLNLLIVTIK